MYDVVLTTLAAKQLRACDHTVARRIQGAIELLRKNPHPPKARKLSGRDGYRVRVGGYRIIYDVIDRQLIIRVLRLGHRRDIYRSQTLTS